MVEYEEQSLKNLNPMAPPSQLEEDIRDQPDTDFTVWDFHPDEPNPPI
jgi:hypothetical protein